jgi:hypothetical protein
MMTGEMWESLLTAYRAGQADFRRKIEEVIVNQRPDVWTMFGQSMLRKIDTPGDPIAADMPLMVSVLKHFVMLVDPACIAQLSVPKSFFYYLAKAISDPEGSVPLRGTAILVAGRVILVLPQHSKSFGLLMNAFRSELARVAAEHAASSNGTASEDKPAGPVVQPNEIIIHQIIDVLKNMKNISKLEWARDLVASIRDVHSIVKSSEVFRPQCQVEVMQIFGKLFEIAAANAESNDITSEEWLGIATDVVSAVRRAKVVHDTYQETLYNLIDLAAAASPPLWTEETFINCSDLCNEEIKALVLTNVFDVKINESLLGMLGVLYEKYPLLLPAAAAEGKDEALPVVSEDVLLNIGLTITTIRDLQGSLVLFLNNSRRGIDKDLSRKEQKAAAERLGDIRHACADVRNSAISTSVLVTKAVPQWVQRCPELFWELCTGQLRTPLLFSHCLVQEASFDVSLVDRIVAHLKGALVHIEKYSVKDACNLVLSISDVVGSHQYRLYIASSNPGFAVELVVALGRCPKLPTKAASSDDGDNTIAGWKLVCCNCIQSLLNSVISVYSASLPGKWDGENILSSEFCDLFVRNSMDIYVTLHRACGLFGGPKGVAVAERAKPAQLEAERLIDTSDFDAIEPILLALAGTVLSFIEVEMMQPSASASASAPADGQPPSYWWTGEESLAWREYEHVNALSVVIVFVSYLTSSLSRPVKYENDVDLICGDIEMASRFVDLLFQWNAAASNAGAGMSSEDAATGNEFRLLEMHISPALPKGLKIASLISDLASSLCQKLSDIRQLENSPLGDESKCVLFDMTKDSLQQLETGIFTFKKRLCPNSAPAPGSAAGEEPADRATLLEQNHARLVALLATERFDHTTAPASAATGGAAAKFKHVFHNGLIDLLKC